MLHFFSSLFVISYFLVNVSNGVGCNSTAGAFGSSSDDFEFVTGQVFGCNGILSGGVASGAFLCESPAFELCTLQKTKDLGLTYGLCSQSSGTGTNFYAANVGAADFNTGCEPSGIRGVYGCFYHGNTPATGDFWTSTENMANYSQCGGLQTQLSVNVAGYGGWNGVTDLQELNVVTHTTVAGGGVLCCATQPTNAPTNAPINAPSNAPSSAPTPPSAAPTNAPINAPTNAPSSAPSPPSAAPSIVPTAAPLNQFAIHPSTAANVVSVDFPLFGFGHLPMPLDTCQPENPASLNTLYSKYTCATATSTPWKTFYNDSHCGNATSAPAAIIPHVQGGSCAAGAYKTAGIQIYIQNESMSDPVNNDTGCTGHSITQQLIGTFHLTADVCVEVSQSDWIQVDCSAEGFVTIQQYTDATCTTAGQNQVVINSTRACQPVGLVSGNVDGWNGRVYVKGFNTATVCTTGTISYSVNNTNSTPSPVTPAPNNANIISVSLALWIAMISYLFY